MLKRSHKWRVILKLLNFLLHAKKRAVRNVWCLWSTKKKPHYDDFTETHYTATILMAVSFNAIHKKCKASYSKTLEDICNVTDIDPHQKCIKIQFFDLMHTNLLVIGNRGSENRRNILEIKITMLKRVEKFCDPRWSCNLCNTTIRRHCTLHCTPLPFNGLVLSLSPTDRRVLVSRECGTIYWSVWRAM